MIINLHPCSKAVLILCILKRLFTINRAVAQFKYPALCTILSKTGLMLLLSIFGFLNLKAQTTYYSNNTTTNFNTLTGWSLNTNGTGANPAALDNTVRLVVQNGHTKNTSATATVNRLTIQNGASVTSNNAITVAGTTPQFNINDGGTYVHNNTGTLSSTIFAGTEAFGATSTFQINNWQNTSTNVTPASLSVTAIGFDGNAHYYGHLIINWAAGALWEQGWTSVTIRLTAGNLQFTSSFTGEFLFTPNTGPSVTPLVYVAGNFTMNSAGTINFTDFNDPSYLLVNGNVTQTAGTFATSGSGNGSAGYIYTYGTASADWSFTGGTRKLIGYRVTANKTVNLKANFNLGQASDAGWVFTVIFYLEANAVFDAENYTITCAYFTQFATAGRIRTSNTNGIVGSTTTTLSNLPTVQWGIVADCTVECYAAGAQTVSAVPIYENVTILNGGTKSLNGDATVFKTFNFTGAGNYLNIGNNNFTVTNTGAITNAGSTSYFITSPTTNTNGRLRQNGLTTAARLFPIGTATNYLPLTVTPAVTGSSFSTSVFRSTTVNGSPAAAGFGNRTFQVDAVWWIDQVTGTSSATLLFEWQTNTLEGANFSALTGSAPGPNQIGIWRNTVPSGPWALVGGPNYNTSNTSNFASNLGTITSWGTAGTGLPYIVANILILPSALKMFAATPVANGNRLNWELEQPERFKLFVPEESNNGVEFNELSPVTPVFSEAYNYNHITDKGQTKYYRLKMVDHSGSVTYSHVVSVGGKKQTHITLLQNPVQNQLLFRHPQANNANYTVTDLSGRRMLQGVISKNAAVSTVNTTSLSAGMYVLRYYNSGEVFTTTFVKQ